MFFIAAALLLTTAGVFAGKARFVNPTNVYAYDGSDPAKELTASPFSGSFTTTTAGNEFQFVAPISTTTYGLYQIVSGVYTPVTFNF